MLTSDRSRAVPAKSSDQNELSVQELEQQLQLGLDGPSDLLRPTLDYAISTTGKLLRPRLLLDACAAVGGDVRAAVAAAAGTEFGHIASLIHDDVIDGDAIRRGRPSIQAAFGVPMAILSGDLLVFEMFLSYTRSSEFGISPERTLAAIRMLSQTCIDVCRGQVREAELAGHFETTLDQYLDVIRLKTASVCRASCEIGATLGGGNDAEVTALAAYGEALGLAFQVVDDILEYTGTQQDLGKPLDSDMRNGRITLPVIYALESDSTTHAEVVRLLSNHGAAHAQLARVLRSSGAIGRAQATAKQWACVAQSKLEVLPDSVARRQLAVYANELVNRRRERAGPAGHAVFGWARPCARRTAQAAPRQPLGWNAVILGTRHGDVPGGATHG